MLSMLRIKFSVLFGTYTLLDKSLRVLQLPTHLSNLDSKWIVEQMDSRVILDCIH